MKRFILILFLLVAGVGYSQVPALVQKAQTQSSAGPSTISTSFASLPKIGNTVIVFFSPQSFPSGNGSVADNQGNVYTLNQSAGGGGQDNLFAWSAPVTVSSGTFTITAQNPSGGSVASLWLPIFEYSGLNGAVDVSTGSGVPSSGVTITTANANDLVISALATGNGSNFSPSADSGFTIQETASGWGSKPLVMEDRVVAATGTFTLSIGSTDAAARIAIAFKGVGGSNPILNGTAFMNGKAILQ